MTTGFLTPGHIVLLLIAVLLILGPRRLPQAGHALGQSIREFKEAIAGRDAEGNEQSGLPRRSGTGETD
jgi:sec-independent protein translocase protein TatA